MLYVPLSAVYLVCTVLKVLEVSNCSRQKEYVEAIYIGLALNTDSLAGSIEQKLGSV